MHVHQVPVALGVAVVTRVLVTFERHVLSRMRHRRLGCHHRVDSCRWCLFGPSFVFAACQRLRFCQSPVFFFTAGEPGMASFSTRWCGLLVLPLLCVRGPVAAFVVPLVRMICATTSVRGLLAGPPQFLDEL